MELTRRQFAKSLAAAAAMAAAGLVRGVKPSAMRRYAGVLRGRLFPGRVRPLCAEQVDGPAKWLG